MPQDRNQDLKRMQTLLSTPDGELFMREMRFHLTPDFAGKPPHAIQQMSGGYIALQFIEELAAGELIQTGDEVNE